jgi:hypothetical protein
MSVSKIRNSSQHPNSEELRVFQARVVKLRARAFQRDLSIPQLKERVAKARQQLAATNEPEYPQN